MMCKHKWLAVGEGDKLVCTLCGLEDNAPCCKEKKSCRAVQDEAPPSWDNAVKAIENAIQR